MTIAVSITAMLIGFTFAAISPLKLFIRFPKLNEYLYHCDKGVLIIIYLFFGGSRIMFVASMFGYNEYIEIMLL